MITTTEQFITRMKLHESHKQRERLQAAYSDLLQQADSAPDDAERLRLLYDGLRELKFADRPLHPEVDNLDIVLHENAAPEMLAYWLAELERHLQSGQQRAEFVYMLGALLEEWSQEGSMTSDADPEREQLLRDLVLQLKNPMPPTDHEAFLRPLITSLLDDDHASDAAELRRNMDTHYLGNNILGEIRDNHHRPAHLRQQAEYFLNAPLLLNEFSDALTIMLNHLDTWAWPNAGVRAYMLRTGGKARLFLDEDLPTAALLEVLGNRWCMAYWYLIFDDAAHGLTRDTPDLWSGMEHSLDKADSIDRSIREKPEPRYTPKGKLVYSRQGDRGSILGQRRQEQGGLQDAVWRVNYSQEGYQGGTEAALRLLNAEMRLWRAAFPDKPLYVLKVDLKDFYPSVSHQVLQTALRQAHVPEEDRSLIERILSVPIRLDGETVVSARGLPNDRPLSHALGELLLCRLDQHLHRAAPVQVIRIVDDIAVLAASRKDAIAAFHAIQEFCAATGLEINDAKSGSVYIGGKRVSELPEGLPTWKLIRLDEDGEWSVDQAALADRLAETRHQVESAASIIAAVEAYNAGLRELLDNLALDVRLGARHRQDVNDAVVQFHYGFSDQGSIVDWLRDALRSRFLGDSDVDIPEAWLYWPLTAGGLGLIQPIIETTSYEMAYQATEPPSAPADRPEDWQHKPNEWSSYYRYWLDLLKPASPKPTQVMEALVKDFIQRGSQMSGKQQKTLSPYWRWVLYTYGPQIIETLGSFRFLITELVPLQLIVQSRRQLAPSEQEAET